MKIFKSTVTQNVIVCFYNLGEENFNSSSFCNISNFNNGFIWNPSKVQRSLFEWKVTFPLTSAYMSKHLKFWKFHLILLFQPSRLFRIRE